MILLTCFLLAVIFLLIKICQEVKNRHQAHQFFKIKSPELPTLPNPNLFFGHIYETFYPSNSWEVLKNFHLKYGSTYGLYMANQPWVSTKDVDLIKKVFADEGHKHINRATHELPYKVFKFSIFQVKNDEWRLVRRAVNPAFSNHTVRSTEISTDIEDAIKELDQVLEARIEQAKPETGIELNASDMFSRLTLSVIFRIVFKLDDAVDFRGDHDFWTDTINNAARHIKNPLMPLNRTFSFLEPLFCFLIRFHPVGFIDTKTIEFIKKTLSVNQHLSIQGEDHTSRESGTEAMRGQASSRRRLVDHLIDQLMSKKITYNQFLGSSQFLLFAGFQTSAEAITYLNWQLTRHPDIQDKLRRCIQAEGIESEYLTWCINEALRLHTPVPLGAGRVLAEDVTCNGLLIPKGTFVTPSTHSVHLDPKNWANPDLFEPERWQNSTNLHPAAFLAFGLGPRYCVGSKLAMHEIKLVMQMLLTHYKVVKSANTPDEYNFSSAGMIFTTPAKPVMLRLEPLSRQESASSSS